MDANIYKAKNIRKYWKYQEIENIRKYCKKNTYPLQNSEFETQFGNTLPCFWCQGMSTLGYSIVLFFGIWLIRAEKSGCQETKRGNKGVWSITERSELPPAYSPRQMAQIWSAHKSLFQLWLERNFGEIVIGSSLIRNVIRNGLMWYKFWEPP